MQRIDPRDREEIVRILAPLAQRHQAIVYLFGSRARGDARRTSDIDLAVRAAMPIPADTLAEAKQALEDSRVPFRVDLVDYETAASELRQAIDAEGVAWIG
ncbi:hypothetical protein EDC36_11627 [Tepidimonas ignava]|uniref:Nucleotidyltransferase domain protein n=1 Tax=Tepidimonas ignava TaxID=114249 RepID=A0A4R3L5U6_9BURK|nr:hypothetical protein EDC36_11627 [Tepidimonas ignava]TSE19338.1 Nucleotidyltransferase domain protein [Tepidimonas ignava]